MGGACSTYGGRGADRIFDLRRRGHLDDSGVGGTIILKLIYKKWDRKAWTELIWLRDRWRAVVNAVMNFGFNNMRGISGPAGNLLASQEEA